MRELQNTIGYQFRDPELLRLALTHPSAGPQNNQRLEFLGDAVLELYVSDMLYRKYPELHEGELSSRRASLVCERTLSVIALSLDLGRCLILDGGAEQTGGRQKPSILADATEAVLAAIYLDGGAQAAQAVILRLFEQDESLIAWRGLDDKGALQKYTVAHGLDTPVYEVVAQSGPDHDRHFTVRVLAKGEELAQGEGRSKQAAEKAAARKALALYESSET